MPSINTNKIVRIRYLVGLLLIGLLSFFAYSYLNYNLTVQSKYGELINTSGRQRMLSQRTTLLVKNYLLHEIQNDEKFSTSKTLLDRDLQLFLNSHESLKSGVLNSGETIGLGKKILHQYSKVIDPLIQIHLKNIQKAIHSKSDTDFEIMSDFALGPLLFELDKGVKLIEKENSELIQTLQTIEMFVFLFVIFALVMEIFFIFLPMEKIIEENFDEIEKEKKKAIESLSFKSKFITNMTHELRTPLNGIIGAINIIENSSKTNSLTENQDKEYFEIIKVCADNTLQLVNDVLDFEKIEKGKITLKNTWFSLNDFSEEVEKMFILQSKEKGIDLTVQNELKDYELHGDDLRIKQIVINLLSNAIKFTEKGQVELTIKPSELDKGVHITVSDTGVGIPESDLKQVFDAFSQGYHSYRNAIKGTGVGLSLVKKLTNLMKGDLKLKSYPGVGSSFDIWIPLNYRLKENNNITPMRETDGNFSHIKMLVAEDNKVNQIVIKKYLSLLNIEFDIVENGQLALDKIRHHYNFYDLVLLDINMPEMNGIDAIKEIRKFDSQTFISALTANDSREDKTMYIKSGFDFVLTKPITLEGLKNFLSNNLNRIQKPSKKAS